MGIWTSVCLWLITFLNIHCYFVQALPSTESQFRAFRVGLSSEGYTSAISLATDDHGNTFIVGNTDGSFGKADGDNVSADSIFIAKFSRSGILIWLTRTGSAYLDKATSIHFYGSNLYVTGFTRGNVALDKQSGNQRLSRGITDGFIVVYNSFTGKRLWSRQYGVKSTETRIEQVAVSRRGGIVIAGRTNASLFSSVKREVVGQEFFLARLRHATGQIESNVQMETRSVWPFSWPQRLLIVEETSSLYVVLYTNEHDRRKMGVVISIPFNNYNSIERVLHIGGHVVDAGSYYGLAYDQRSGTLVVSFTKGASHSSSASSVKSTFALRIVSNNTRPRQWTEKIFSFDRVEDKVKDVMVNEAGFAMVLGSSKVVGVNTEDGNGKSSVPALWVYDVRTMRTAGSHIADNLDGLHCDKITTFALDSDGNIVYAGVRSREDGTGEVLLGSFGIPAEYKWRSGDYAKPAKIYILDNGSITTNEMLAIQDSKGSKGDAKNDGGEPLNIGSIASICVGSALVAFVFAGLYAIGVKKRKRRKAQPEILDTLSRPTNSRPLTTDDLHRRTDGNERPRLEQLFDDSM
ncbi:WD40/YVTN repeat-like containing protein [Gracilaria domingensis]|nr:WD40/YVTN repeat-like containing protein [Gracilaria domingensis]